MDILRVKGGKTLYGSVSVHGAKNSVLPILAASILAAGESVIHNCPWLSDVEASIKTLTYLGCSVKRENSDIIIDSSVMTRFDIPKELCHEMRSSVIFLGAVLGRMGRAEIYHPGGCDIGERPIDLHIAALRTLGAEISEEEDRIICMAPKLHGGRINLPIPSVGATENAMLAAACCDGAVLISNAAREPEIEDLQNYLRKLGIKINGAGTSFITVEGPIKNHGAEHTVIADRIETATYMTAVAAAGGKAEILNTRPEQILSVINVLREGGCYIRSEKDSIYIESAQMKAVPPIITAPYPGFPTDAQAPVMAAFLRASGTTAFVENIFENRYHHAFQFMRLGALITVNGKTAVVKGRKKLHGAKMKATDLRGGAAMIVAALGVEGSCDISEIHHIERGYENIAESMKKLGALVEKTEKAENN